MPPSPHRSVALCGQACSIALVIYFLKSVVYFLKSVIYFLKSAIHSFTRVSGKHLLCARQDLCLHSTIAFQLNCGVFNSSQYCTQNSGPHPLSLCSSVPPALTLTLHQLTALHTQTLSLPSGEVSGILGVNAVFFSFLLCDVFNVLSYCDVPETCGYEILILTILQQVLNQCLNKLIPAGL